MSCGRRRRSCDSVHALARAEINLGWSRHGDHRRRRGLAAAAWPMCVAPRGHLGAAAARGDSAKAGLGAELVAWPVLIRERDGMDRERRW
jgi:hypothetical protein